MDEVIESVKHQIAFWIEHGMDKELPETFEKMKSNLKRLQKLAGDVEYEDGEY